MKKPQVPKEELLAFQEACAMNKLPVPEFNKERESDIFITNSSGKPIYKVFSSGKLVKIPASKEDITIFVNQSTFPDKARLRYSQTFVKHCSNRVEVSEERENGTQSTIDIYKQKNWRRNHSRRKKIKKSVEY